MLDLFDTRGDLTLAIENIKQLKEVTEVRNETFNVVTSAGMGIQQRDKIGFEIQCINGDTRAVTARALGLGNQTISFQDCPFHHSRENSFSDFSIFHFLVLVCVFKLTNFISRFLARSCFYLWF